MGSAASVVALFGLLGLGNDAVNFDAVKPGYAPPNWSFSTSHNVPRGPWEVRFDPSAPSRGNVLKRVVSTPKDIESPVAVFDKVVCRDGDLSVKFKIDGSGGSHSAGIVWRYQDPSNYYLLHFSADSNTVILYRVKEGHSEPLPIYSDGKPLGSKLSHNIDAGRWYVTRVSFRGSKIRVLLGNRRLFDADDKTFSAAGKTGVWARGRTTAAFDDFRIDKKG